MRVYGLYTHIAANRTKSIILLLGFVLLLEAVTLSVGLVIETAKTGELGLGFEAAIRNMPLYAPTGVILAGIWFLIAWIFNTRLIEFGTGAHAVSRENQPDLYAVLENLCISRGIPTPQLRIIDTNARNAYASGLRSSEHAIAVTRGLVEALEPAELEAVLAHELTHLRNRDTELMIVAMIFAGIFGFLADITFRNWDFPFGWSPKLPSSAARSKKGGAAVLVAIVIALAVVAISWGVSFLIRLAISRSREYLADAGSAELTKNPDAMISALRKIEGHAAIDKLPSRLQPLFVETPAVQRVSFLFQTHPTVEQRIAALVKYAGGREQPGS